MSPAEQETDSLGSLEDRIQRAVQLVGRLRQESDLLAAAAVFEAAGNLLARWPSLEVQ